MSYDKTPWVNGSTALSAEHMNHIEQGIYEAHSLLDVLVDSIYPIDSIFMSTSSANPSTLPLLANTEWEEWGSGRVPVGVNAADSDFNAPEMEGGNKDAIIPYHNHALTNPTVTVPKHTHTLTNPTVTVPKHTHGFTNPSVTGGGVTNGITGGGHTHAAYKYVADKLGSGTLGARIYNPTGGTGTVMNTNSTTHTHTLPNHNHTVSGGAVGEKAAFAATVSGGSIAEKPAVTATVSGGGVGYSGSSVSKANMQPYITCYMWKRVS